jgi:hypothetical protein
MNHQRSLAMIPVRIGLLFGLVALVSVACGALGHTPAQAAAGLQAPTVWPDKQFTVDAAGNISPQQDELHSGQTAVWTFATASPANALVRQTWIDSHYAAAPYDPSYVNEFMTPLPKGMSGIFVISETEGGLVEQTSPCVAQSETKATRTVDGTLWYLCTTDSSPTAPHYQKTMDSTWANPAITGVFIRLKWSDLQTSPTTYNDSILLREVDKAVANGKLYSIAIKSGAENDATPSWLFYPPPAGAGLTPVMLDWNEDSPDSNTPLQAYGDPTDAIYRQLYFDMLSHVASVLKQDSARWRALAYVKLSGANSRSAENRLPSGCKTGRDATCNNKAWAEAGYTPDGLELFYQEQMRRIAQEFPGKSMSFSLIQAGLPRVNNAGCYLDATDTNTCPLGVDPLANPMIGPFRQTENIINYARSTYGDDVAIAHLGLGPKPDFSDPTKYAVGTGCPLPLAPNGTYAHGPNGVGSGCPNKWATDVGAVGGLTHFQTNNASGVGNSAQLASALDNMWSNSNSAMLEIYEARAWEASDSILDRSLPPNQQHTLAEWNQRLHDRRRANFPALGDPAPRTISFTFTRSKDPYETFYYFVPKSGPRSPAPVSPLLGYIKLIE